MTTRWRKLGIRATAGLAVAGAPVAAACSSGPTSSGPSYEDWATTDGAAGRINLEDVQTAFKESKSVTDFEKRVNEIFEGDGVVLIKAEQTDTAFVLEGWEDLDRNLTIDDAQDDKLFSITEKEDKSYDMRGYHANSYYHSTWGPGNFLFTYLLLSSFTGPRYVYATDIYRADTIRGQRDAYRHSSDYRSQVSKNSTYFNSQKGFAGSSYDSAGRKLSSARQSYQSRARSTGSFRSSTTGVRSSWGTSGGRGGFSSGRGGFFRGGGGQTALGSTRLSRPPHNLLSLEGEGLPRTRYGGWGEGDHTPSPVAGEGWGEGESPGSTSRLDFSGGGGQTLLGSARLSRPSHNRHTGEGASPRTLIRGRYPEG